MVASVGSTNHLKKTSPDCFLKYEFYFFQWYNTTNFSPMKLMGDNKVVAGYHAGMLAVKDPKSIRAALEAVIKLYDEGKVKPEVYEVFSLEEVKKLNM
jgi:NADPH:quinone reductase-like Zn-dependent oxidoreductase